MGLLYANQYFTTTLNVGGGIDSSQTTGIIVSGVSGLDIAKAGMALVNYADPLNTTIAEWIEYTSIDGSNELQGVVRGSEGFSAKAHDNGVTIAFPLTESHINRLNLMFDSTGVDIKQIATPSNPASGRDKLYFKSDDILYKLTSGGTETAISSKIAQVVTYVTGAVATGTTVMPNDDTIPQNTEGDQYMTLAITPTNSSSTLTIQVIAQLNGGANQEMIVALFQDSTAGALAAIADNLVSGEMRAMGLTHKMAAGTTSATTFKVRAGGSNAGTTTFNGNGGTRRFGGVCASSIVITEILP